MGNGTPARFRYGGRDSEIASFAIAVLFCLLAQAPKWTLTGGGLRRVCSTTHELSAAVRSFSNNVSFVPF
jgi:hypothetical protein